MIILPWVNSYDPDYAWISDEFPVDIQDNVDKVFFGESLKGLLDEPLEFKLNKFNGDFIPDYIPNTGAMLIVSERLKEVLAQTGANFEFYSVSIADKNNVRIEKKYYLAHLLDRLDCIDEKQSDVSRVDNSDRGIATISKLVLDMSKIPENTKIFRLSGYLSLIMVERDLAFKIFRELNCRGMIFQILDEYGREFRDPV